MPETSEDKALTQAAWEMPKLREVPRICSYRWLCSHSLW